MEAPSLRHKFNGKTELILQSGFWMYDYVNTLSFYSDEDRGFRSGEVVLLRGTNTQLDVDVAFTWRLVSATTIHEHEEIFVIDVDAVVQRVSFTVHSCKDGVYILEGDNDGELWSCRERWVPSVDLYTGKEEVESPYYAGIEKAP